MLVLCRVRRRRPAAARPGRGGAAADAPRRAHARRWSPSCCPVSAWWRRRVRGRWRRWWRRNCCAAACSAGWRAASPGAADGRPDRLPHAGPVQRRAAGPGARPVQRCDAAVLARRPRAGAGDRAVGAARGGAVRQLRRWCRSATCCRSPTAVEAAVGAVATAFGLALRLAGPFVIASVVWQAGARHVSRLIPQLQIYFAAMPGQIIGGLPCWPCWRPAWPRSGRRRRATASLALPGL